MNVTIRDIAAKAGVSPTTVSLAFQPESRISDKTRRKVLRVVEQMNYVPDGVARSLRSGASSVIGFLVADLANPFYARMIRQAMATGRERGFEVTVTESGRDAGREISSLKGLASARVRGVLACLSEKTGESLGFLANRRIPFVLMDTRSTDYRGPFVGNDLHAAGRLAARHLLDVGCSKVAMLTASASERSSSAFVAMERSFTDALISRGVGFDPAADIVEAGLALEAGRDGMLRLLDQSPGVEGVFCVSDLCAIGAMTAADSRGRKPGSDLAVMGVDDLDVSGVPRIDMTSIRQPLEEIARVATNRLLDSVQTGEPLDVDLMMEPQLVVRGSTRLARA